MAIHLYRYNVASPYKTMADRKGIYFGTIAAPTAANELVPSSVKSSSTYLPATTQTGSVNVSDTVDKEVLELSESSRVAQEKHAQLLRRMEAEKRARNISVPTSIDETIARLRQLGHPITLFGERPADRRERLRQALSQLQLEAEETGIIHSVLEEIQTQTSASRVETEAADSSKKEQKDQLFYIPIKNVALKQARASIFAFAIPRTKARLKREELHRTMSVEDAARMDSHAADLYMTAEKMINVASQNGDVRPLSSVRYSCDSSYLATGSWSGLVKVWDAANLTETKVFRGHDDRVTGIAWHPTTAFADMSDSSDKVCLGSASADSTAMLWSATRSDPVATLRGHQARLCKVAFHPSGDFVGTTSFDHSWRLWDVATAQELLLQEGHYKEVYAISFHPDGSLVATGDLHGIGRIWDIRSGKAILPLQGHSKQILCMDFSNSGFLLASGSDDRSVRIWDLRQRKCSYVIPAHNNLVSEVRFSPGSDEILLSASYDASIKLWRTRDWKLLSTLKGHDGKVTSADFAGDEKHVVSCGFDRTFKTWAHEQEF